MGFVSKECPKCERSILTYLCLKDTGVDRKWSECIVVEPDGNKIVGLYDGYGRIESKDKVVDLDPFEKLKFYHYHCYEELGRPSYEELEFSIDAYDQGFFIDISRYS